MNYKTLNLSLGKYFSQPVKAQQKKPTQSYTFRPVIMLCKNNDLHQTTERVRMFSDIYI